MKKIEYTIQGIKIESNIVYLNLVPKNPARRIKFRPGQYGLVSFLNGNILSQERPFSFASSPTNEVSLQFGFKIFGQFTSDLSEVKVGESLFVRGPYGSFIFNEKKLQDAVFLAAGIGITPFLSAISYASDKRLANKLTLLFSNKNMAETPFFNELRKLEKLNKNFTANFIFSNETGNIPAKYIKERINEEIISKIVQANMNRKTFFICGPMGYTRAVTEILKKLMINEKEVKTEEFSLAPKSFFEKGSLAFPLTAGASAALSLVIVYSIYAQANVNQAMANDPPPITSNTGIQTVSETASNQPAVTPDIAAPVITPTLSNPVPTPKKVSRTTNTTVSTPTVTQTTPAKITTPVYTPPTPAYTPPRMRMPRTTMS